LAKIKIKNSQLAKAVKLTKVKKPAEKKPPKPKKREEETPVEEAPPEKKRVRAKSRSAFAEEPQPVEEVVEEKVEEAPTAPVEKEPKPESEPEPVAKEEVTPPPPEPEKKKPAMKIGVIRKPEPPRAPKVTPPQGRAPAVGQRPGSPSPKAREFRDLRPKRPDRSRPFDGRDRQGLRSGDDEQWRRRRRSQKKPRADTGPIIRPSELTVRLPISIKDLASAMKLKAAELISKLFGQGVIMTLNDSLDDETTVQLLGQDFGCEITVDTTEEERIQITDQSVTEEIGAADAGTLQARPPVAAFMGHVDHGKTSLIDRIRESNRASGEAGAITQHIGAFQCETKAGRITVLDTPGHEAFTAMRARGAEVTDVVILVIAGDEGIRPQTEEAIQHARAAEVTILVAINKCDKPDFDAEKVYRQLADLELLPEAWGGDTVTVNCSAVSGEGIDELLEMIGLQADVLELKADPSARARGSVIESEMHKGLGVVATILVQNGTLQRGDSIVFGGQWGRVKTMRNEFGKELKEAGPSTPTEITGISGLPDAGDEFIVVKSEKEAREIGEARQMGRRERLHRKRPMTLEAVLQEAAAPVKKELRVILRADVQGSLEALKTAVTKIESEKAQVEVIFSGIGAISESDVELAMASDALIVGFHTSVESHAEPLIKQHKVQIVLHDVIYKAVDEITDRLAGRLDKVAEEHERGKAEVQAIFRSSQLGTIAGCLMSDGVIHRNHRIRVLRAGETIWDGPISSIKRDKEDVREVKAGVECGILLDGFNDVQEGDILQAYEIIYVAQSL
jgi:translation initiation factor IF-2